VKTETKGRTKDHKTLIKVRNTSVFEFWNSALRNLDCLQNILHVGFPWIFWVL